MDIFEEIDNLREWGQEQLDAGQGSTDFWAGFVRGLQHLKEDVSMKKALFDLE